MFRCTNCKVVAPSGLKAQITALLTRAVTYANTYIDEEGEEQVKLSHGSEIQHEARLCPTCAGTSIPTPTPFESRRQEAHYMQAHPGKCKLTLEDCKTCQSYIRTYRKFSLAQLSDALEERRKKDSRYLDLPNTLGLVVVENMVRRTEHQSKRAQRDFQTAFNVLKPYEEAGGKLQA
jgi:hypothetical protein